MIKLREQFNQPQKLDNVQYLRAFAAINVVLFHIIGHTHIDQKYTTVFLKLLTGWGQNGVDLFFVISGFIMIYIQNLKARTPVSFILERIRRIVPIYWLFNFVMVALVLIFPSSFNTTKFNVSWILTSLFFVSGYAGFINPFLLPGWTLEVEMLFYALFFISLFLKKLRLQVLVMLMLIVGASVILQSYIMLEFALGILIGTLYTHRKLNYKIAISCLIIGSVSLLATISHSELVVSYRFIFWGLPSSLILIGLLYIKQIKNRFWGLLGDASYSIYLIQVFSIPVFFKMMNKFYNGQQGESLINDVIVLLCLVFTVIPGVIFYKLIEKPIFMWLKKNT